MNFKRPIFYLALITALISWPISLTTNPPDQNFTNIIYKDQMEIIAYQQKNGLIATPLKRPFYNKYTIYSQHYFTNFLYLIDPNNYFFSSHPRESAYPYYRHKFPFISIFPALIGLLTLMTNKKTLLKLILITLPGLFIVPIFKNVDGPDIYLIIPFAIIFYFGYLKISRFKYGFTINTLNIIISLLEIYKSI